MIQAQADQAAENMRKKLEEKKQQREATVMAGSPPTEKKQKREEEEQKEEEQWAEPRKHWGQPLGKLPVMAQQCQATGVVRDGELVSAVCLHLFFSLSLLLLLLLFWVFLLILFYFCAETTSNIVFEHPESKPGDKMPEAEARKHWEEKEGIPLVAMLQEKTLQTATYAVKNNPGSPSNQQASVVLARLTALLCLQMEWVRLKSRSASGLALIPQLLMLERLHPSVSRKKTVLCLLRKELLHHLLVLKTLAILLPEWKKMCRRILHPPNQSILHPPGILHPPNYPKMLHPSKRSLVLHQFHHPRRNLALHHPKRNPLHRPRRSIALRHPRRSIALCHPRRSLTLHRPRRNPIHRPRISLALCHLERQLLRRGHMGTFQLLAVTVRRSQNHWDQVQLQNIAHLHHLAKKRLQ